LSRRIGELAEPFDHAPGALPDRCLAAAERGLLRLLSDREASRAGALDLLAVDALVTYAFEAASDTPERIPALAADAMHRLSALVVRP
jgi:hypothetical protein